MERSETPAYILVGMMGAGKSAVGRSVAELTSRSYLDTDSLIVQRLGRTIPQIFKVYGEDAFRDHETAALRSLEPGPIILATGGGVILREANRAELRRCGISLYLRVSTDVLIQRLQISRRKRPLLEADDWQARLTAIAAEREKYYLMADAVLDIGTEGVEEVAAASAKLFREIESDWKSATA